ncbi:hypothetical protein swp_0925 [Shewanella piezotolerans WP3]|uniref:Uncharacterized protein n=1 Tax=Shewanella piezotolerans (strain WP3 / JCM 13877) TaxID=225849 RepID=B8CK28_SHEPW|nr:hypothetical protein swp_0925 [Shewanella piezotolerans WP3]
MMGIYDWLVKKKEPRLERVLADKSYPQSQDK